MKNLPIPFHYPTLNKEYHSSKGANMTTDTNLWKDNDYPNLITLFESAEKKFANNPLFGTKNKDGEYEWVTYKEVGERVQHFRGGLAQLGVTTGDRVGIISKNRAEWLIAEMASFGLGAWFVPMYEKELVSVWQYTIEDAGCKILLVSTLEIFEKVKDFPNKIDSLEQVILIDGSGKGSMQFYEKLGKKNPVEAVHPDAKDVAVIIYTSGTTGNPKGVMLTHGNLCFASQAGYHLYSKELIESSVSFSHLPWAHSYGITAELHNVLQFGGSIGLMDTLKTMADDLKKVRPTVLISVPRVFNTIYRGIYKRMKSEGGVKQKLFLKAVSSAKKRFLHEKNSVSYALLNRLVLDKIRDQFGGRLQLALTASARMNEEVALFFYSIGIPTYDAYGLTETSPVITMNAPNEYKFGSVGKPVEKTRVVIDKSVNEKNRDDGEIVVYGPQVMEGYYNKPSQTKKVLQKDGGLRTGDRGKLDKDGFLFITGRIKEQYKLQNGKFIFPAAIEEEIKRLPYVANALVYGDGEEYNVCLVVLDVENIEGWAREMQLDIHPSDLIAGVAKHGSDLKQFLVNAINKSLQGNIRKYEIPKKYFFITEDFTHENGMLTQTMKLKRREILKKYGKHLLQLYDHSKE